MKKIFALLTCFAFVGVLSAQTTTSDNTEPVKTEKVKDCAKGEKAKAGCCAGKAKASKDTKASTTEVTTDAPKAGCCAGKAKASTGGCHGAKADGHGHAHGSDHASLKEHVCTEACKEGAHAYACGEVGHTCSEACHAHAH